LRTTRFVLGLEHRIHGFDLDLGGQVFGLRGEALDVDLFSLVCLVFMLTGLVL